MNRGVVREFDIARDAAAVVQLDTSFKTRRIFQADAQGEKLCLTSVAVLQPIEKRFPLELDKDPWQAGWVVVETDMVLGFIATALQQWN